MTKSICAGCAVSGWALGMMLTVSAAQNPCPGTWQWEWQWQPNIDEIIISPNPIPDQCVGLMTIVAEAITTPGAIWERDVSDCGGGTRNEAEVPINPEKEWLMYSCPPGTTPISGEGFTATFTTTHGGQVVVQFKARAAVATPNPPYDQQVSGLTNPFRVFEVISLEPDFGLLAVDNDADPRRISLSRHQQPLAHGLTRSGMHREWVM